MSIRSESGRRFVQCEAEVPGAPDEVWDAIATGPGVTSWFVPTDMRTDGTIVSEFGPGMESVALLAEWDPPRRFVAESDGFDPNGPSLETEWCVEARPGGRCVVRVVHSLPIETDEWDRQLESIEAGWPDYFRLLVLYLRHFPGRSASTSQFMAVTPKPAAEVWDRLTAKLPFSGALAYVAACQRILLSPSMVVHLFAMPMGKQTVVCLRTYDFGDTPAVQPDWQQWLQAIANGS